MVGPGQGAYPTEIEWQFDALDLRPVERWLATLPTMSLGSNAQQTVTALAKTPRRLADSYVDTDDWRMARAGFVVRTRRRGRDDEVTLKDMQRAGSDGLRQRLEVNEALPSGGLGALGADGPVGWRVHAIAGRRPLRQVLEIRTRRRPFALRVGGIDAAEIALDETTVVVGPGQRPMQLRRVEVEVQPEWLEALTPLVEQLRMACGLQPAALSKFEAGLLALGVELPAAPDLGPTSVGPDSTTGDLAYAVLRRQVAVLRDKEPGTRLGEDIEELHDMRVATRRLRAALDVFEEVLPVRACTYRDELGWLAGVLGAVRDLDVQQEALPGMSATANAWASLAGGSSNPLADLAALLERERASARAAMLDSLDSLRWDRLINGLTAMVRQGPLRRSLAVRTPALIAVPELVGARHRAAVKAARRAKRSGQAPDFHRLRIRCKRLRYSLEFTADLYGGRTTRYTRQLTSLQDKLGLMQDAEVAADRLADLALGEAHLPASTVFVMGAVAEHHRRDSERLLRRLPKQVSRLGGQRWRDLADLMEQERARALALQPPVRRTLRAVPTPTTEAAPPASGEPSSPTDPSTRAEPTIAADPSTPSEFEVGHTREEVRQTEGPV